MTCPRLSFVSILLAAPAFGAGVCVAVDEKHDTLPPAELKAARTALIQAFLAEGFDVVDEGCAETYVVLHARLTKVISVSLRGPLGSRQANAGSLDELPLVYSQMVRSLKSGKPIGTGNEALTRDNVTRRQELPVRATADHLGYTRLGVGFTRPDPGFVGGAIGFGYRYELDDFGIDVSFMNFTLTFDNQTVFNDEGSFTPLRLYGCYFFDAASNTTPYVGIGPGVGGTFVDDDMNRDFRGWGVQGELIGGFEFGRASNIRFAVDLLVTLPFYKVERGDEDHWMPQAAVMFAAYTGSKPDVRVQRVIQE
jgi:hypothetical protein